MKCWKNKYTASKQQKHRVERLKINNQRPAGGRTTCDAECPSGCCFPVQCISSTQKCSFRVSVTLLLCRLSEVAKTYSLHSPPFLKKTNNSFLTYSSHSRLRDSEVGKENKTERHVEKTNVRKRKTQKTEKREFEKHENKNVNKTAKARPPMRSAQPRVNFTFAVFQTAKSARSRVPLD